MEAKAICESRSDSEGFNQEIEALLERDGEPCRGRTKYRGVLVDETWTKSALINLVHYAMHQLMVSRRSLDLLLSSDDDF